MGPQSVAGGQTVTSNIKSSNTALGTITVSPVVIASGASSTTTTQFQPNNTSTTGGSVTISADVPPGFTAPSADQSTTAIVNIPGMSLAANGRTIGQNLQIQDSVILGALARPAAYKVTITSNNPGLLMLAANPTDAGTPSITITIPATFTSGSYYLQAFSNSGTPTYSATAPAFRNLNASLTLSKSGLVIVGPLGPGAPGANVSLAAGPQSNWSVYTAELDASGNYVGFQALCGGATAVTANLSSSNTGAGTVPASVTINPGATSVPFTFTPVASGTSTTVGVTSSFGVANNIPPSKDYNIHPGERETVSTRGSGLGTMTKPLLLINQFIEKQPSPCDG